MAIFSERHNYSAPDAEITVREDAPEVLRGSIVVLASKAGMGYETLRKEVCGLLGVAPDTRGNWSEPNVLSEVQNHLEDCDWFEVYDVIEGIATSLQSRPRIYGQSKSPADVFADGINKIFRKNGIGWQLLGNRIEFRGSEAFEVAVREGTKELRSAGKNTTANELHEALRDLSRRPNPELTGAVQHGMAALECLAKDLSRTIPATPRPGGLPGLWICVQQRATPLGGWRTIAGGGGADRGIVWGAMPLPRPKDP